MDEKEKLLAEQEAAKAKLETELADLTKQVDAKQGQDAGLDAAVQAKKKDLADLGDKIRKTREQDQSKFEQVRIEHLQEAQRQLVVRYPELADPAQLAAVVSRFTSKDDSGKFEVPAILQDLTMAYYNSNPQKFLKIVQTQEEKDEVIRKAKAAEAAGAGGYNPPDTSTDLTPEEQRLVRETGVSPEFVKKQRGKDNISGGLLTGKEKMAE